MRIACFGDSHLWTLFGWSRWSQVSGAPMELSLPGLGVELVGWKFGDTGPTAYGLIDMGESETRAGQLIHDELDRIGRVDNLLLSYGEVDCADHIGRDGKTLEDAVGRYVEFLVGLALRPNVRRISVASAVPQGVNFRGSDRLRIQGVRLAWNSALRDAGLSVADWYTPFLDGDHLHDALSRDFRDPNECHLTAACQLGMLDAAVSSFRLQTAGAGPGQQTRGLSDRHRLEPL